MVVIDIVVVVKAHLHDLILCCGCVVGDKELRGGSGWLKEARQAKRPRPQKGKKLRMAGNGREERCLHLEIEFPSVCPIKWGPIHLSLVKNYNSFENAFFSSAPFVRVKIHTNVTLCTV